MTPHQVSRRKLSFILPVLAILFIAGIFLWLAHQPYPELKEALDHLAGDGSLESFTPEAHAAARTALRLLAVALISAAGFTFLAPQTAAALLRSFGKETRAFFLNFPRETAAALRGLPARLLRKDILIPAAVLTLLAILARVIYLNDPMEHDEAYSFVIFAKLPLRLAVADYHFPNNHLLNTLLTHLSQQLFGNDPWVVRLPAFIAGVALVPAGYLLARQLYDRTAGWLAGAALAAAPVLVSYATNGRGYSMLALCSVLVIILAVDQTRRSNLFYWTLAAVISALGFYALPVFLMPFCIVLVWLNLCGLNPRVISPELRSSWFFRLAYFTGLSLVVAALLYLPVFRYSGVSSVVANPYVETLSWREFWPTFGSRLEDIAVEWSHRTPLIAVLFAALGLALSVILHRRISRTVVSTQLSAVIAISIILLVQRPNPWAKIWQFLFPLLLIWSAGGLAGGLAVLQSRIKSKFSLQKGGAVLAVLALTVTAGVNTYNDHPGLRSQPGSVEQAAIYLSSHMNADDIVVVAPIDDAPLWYYFYKYDLSQDRFRRDIPFKRAFVVVSRKDGQTLDQVLEYRGPDPGFLRMETARSVAELEGLEIYAIDANWAAVSKAYQLNDP